LSELHLERYRVMEFPDDNQKAVALVLAHFARADGEIPHRIYDGLDDGRVRLSLRRCACGALATVEAHSLGFTIATVDAGHRCTARLAAGVAS
jgi:hypothetical protein